MGFPIGKALGAVGSLLGGQQQQPAQPSMVQQMLANYQGQAKKRKPAQTPNLLGALQSLVRPQIAQDVSTKPTPTTRRPQVSTRGNGRVGEY